MSYLVYGFPLQVDKEQDLIVRTGDPTTVVLWKIRGFCEWKEPKNVSTRSQKNTSPSDPVCYPN